MPSGPGDLPFSRVWMALAIFGTAILALRDSSWEGVVVGKCKDARKSVIASVEGWGYYGHPFNCTRNYNKL